MEGGRLESFLKELSRRRQDPELSEEATKQGFVLPILRRLDWDPENIEEVIPEYQVEKRKVDYCLRSGGKDRVYVEVKRTGTDLDAGSHQQQLLDYAFKGGVAVAVLTDGIVWWLYLALQEGNWQDRKFLSIDIARQPPEDAARYFARFLAREPVTSGVAVQAAEELQRSREKQRLVEKTLSKAWRALLEEPDEMLAELVAERVESLCGHRPGPEQVETFLNQISQVGFAVPLQPAPNSQKNVERGALGPRQTGSKPGPTPQAVIVFNQRYRVSSWRGLLLAVCEAVARQRAAQFPQVLELHGRKRPYFSRNVNDLREPAPVAATGIYAETNLSASGCKAMCERVLHACGIDPAVMSIEEQ